MFPLPFRPRVGPGGGSAKRAPRQTTGRPGIAKRLGRGVEQQACECTTRSAAQGRLRGGASRGAGSRGVSAEPASEARLAVLRHEAWIGRCRRNEGACALPEPLLRALPGPPGPGPPKSHNPMKRNYVNKRSALTRPGVASFRCPVLVTLSCTSSRLTE
jgi:hypothetical protein